MTRLKNLEDGQGRIEKRLDKVEDRLTGIETAQVATNKSLNNLEDGQRKLESGQRKLESGQRKLAEGQDEILRELRNLNPSSSQTPTPAVVTSRQSATARLMRRGR